MADVSAARRKSWRLGRGLREGRRGDWRIGFREIGVGKYEFADRHQEEISLAFGEQEKAEITVQVD